MRLLAGRALRLSVAFAGLLTAAGALAHAHLQQQIPASQVVVLPASHLSNIEAAKSFTSALLSFFQGERHGG